MVYGSDNIRYPTPRGGKQQIPQAEFPAWAKQRPTGRYAGGRRIRRHPGVSAVKYARPVEQMNPSTHAIRTCDSRMALRRYASAVGGVDTLTVQPSTNPTIANPRDPLLELELGCLIGLQDHQRQISHVSYDVADPHSGQAGSHPAQGAAVPVSP